MRLSWFILLVSMSMGAQEIPDAPQPQAQRNSVTMTKYDFGVQSAIGAAHLTDFFLTEQCITKSYQQCHEAVLPSTIWKNKPLFLLTEATFSLIQIEVSKDLRRHGHQKYARAWELVNLGAFAGMDAYLVRLVNDKPVVVSTGTTTITTGIRRIQ